MLFQALKYPGYHPLSFPNHTPSHGIIFRSYKPMQFPYLELKPRINSSVFFLKKCSDFFNGCFPGIKLHILKSQKYNWIFFLRDINFSLTSVQKFLLLSVKFSYCSKKEKDSSISSKTLFAYYVMILKINQSTL